MINYRNRLVALLATAVTAVSVLVLPASPAAASTVASSAIKQTASDWQSGVRARGGSATISGIVGDARHAAEGGYHISREDILAAIGREYSTSRSRDLRGPSNLASAIDMNLDSLWMIRTTRRVLSACKAGDYRLQNVRAVNGTLDGVTGIRIEIADGCVLYSSTPDHVWHVHVEFFRDSAADAARQAGFVRVVLGAAPAPALGIAQQSVLRCPVIHNSVLVLQRALNKVGYGPTVAVTGVCDTYTLRALHTFQKRSGLPYSNRVTRGTWIELAKQYHAA